MNRKVILIAIVASVLFASCKTTKKTIKSELPNVSTLADRITQIQQSQSQFTTANVSKMAMTFNLDNRDLNVSATIKIKQDSALHISIQPFMGIEMFKLEMSPDSMKVFDKMNRRYYVLDYSYFSTRFGVDIDYFSFQSLISGRLFCIGQRELIPDSCTLSMLENGNWNIGYQNKNILQSTQILSNNTIQQVILNGKRDQYQMQTSYNDFAVVNAVNFPQRISMLITNKKNKVSCDFSIQKVQFNDQLKFSSSNTAHYTRGNVDQLFKK